MKLFARYNRVNITATIFTFLVGSIAFYFVLNYILVRQLDRSLRVEEQEIIEFVNQNHRLPEIHNTRHQWIEILPVSAPIKHPHPFSAEAYNRLEQESESVRSYAFTVTVAEQVYQVTVSQSRTETEELLQLIILITILMIAMIVLANYLINRHLITRLWRPFYSTIDSIREYEVSGHEPLHLPREEISEMDLLNESLNSMTSRIHQDYVSLKTFTENASHEMQTPLAVIRLKTESLLQMAEGKEMMVQQLLAIEDTTVKLARLNQSLLLLTRLGNRQFRPNESVLLSGILENKIKELQDFVSAKQLAFHQDIQEVMLQFHHHLAEILVSNLLNNAIRYTPPGGLIEVVLHHKELSVSNTASGPGLDDTKIFQRFYKGDQSLESTGLGLAIIREICVVAGFSAVYALQDNKHIFTIRFQATGES